MHSVTVLVIEEGAEAALVGAALAKHSGIRFIDAPNVRSALQRLQSQAEPPALAIVGAGVLAGSLDELLQAPEIRGTPVIGIVVGLSSAAKQRALAAGVREIHERPREWRPYRELIESVVARFTRTGSPPHRGPTS
jgi:hypothetical protein